ncbi:hypothetical protein GCM10023322_42430 [Rugosimonospora acidiphila]|uniref:Uncharacterized protein n=1 Tax=Rugosimonospora acidiphila TaxID=556531 RepID=A0ABP9RZC7_9ACTN
MLEQYRELFASIRKSPLLYLPRADYPSVVAFLEGCDQGNARTLLTGFREWLVTRIGCGNNLVWWSLAAHLTEPVGPKNFLELEPELDALAVDGLCQLLDEFLALRQEPDGLARIYAAYHEWTQARHREGCRASGKPTCPMVPWPQPANPLPEPALDVLQAKEVATAP